MKAVTIDNLPLESHQNYAINQNQKKNSPELSGASYGPPQSEILGTSTIYASELAKLVDSHTGCQPWGSFSPPAGFYEQARRFFGYTILKQMLLEHKHLNRKEINKELEEPNDDQHEDLELSYFHQQFIEKISSVNPANADVATEKQKGTLLTMLESLRTLDEWLVFIHSHKLRHQKG